MFKKLAYFSGWLLTLTLSLILYFVLGLWLSWETYVILCMWFLTVCLTSFSLCVIFAVVRIIRHKHYQRWLIKYRLSRKEYVLRTHWQHGAHVLRNSGRKRPKLSWYFLTGESCGKSTLLAGCGLPRFDDDHEDGVLRRTSTIRWWFFQRLCILELSSRFLNEQSQLRRSWHRMIRWCGRSFRPSGIIIALSAQELIDNDLNALHMLARKQRTFLDPLLKRWGEGLSIHVVVTQCERMAGFTLWQQQLSEAQRRQPLGHFWSRAPHIDRQDDKTLSPLFMHLKQNMSWARLSMPLSPHFSANERNALLDFPETFCAVEPPLLYFIASLCEPNAYYSPAVLRGVWFTATQPLEGNHGRRHSQFIHDLMHQHLPSLGTRPPLFQWCNRALFRYASIVLCSALALWIAVSGGQSYVRLQTRINELEPSELANFIQQEESYAQHSIRDLPFQFVLNQQYQAAEKRLVDLPSTPTITSTVLENYRQQILSSPPASQRAALLKLSRTISQWQEMRNGASLKTLRNFIPVESLRLRKYSLSVTPLTIVATERYYMRQPEGEKRLQAAITMLNKMVTHDLSAAWLTEPDLTFKAYKASYFWPQLPQNIALSEIWTQQGLQRLKGWIDEIETAAGAEKKGMLEQHYHLLLLRQNAWRNYLLQTSAGLSALLPVSMHRNQLLAIEENQSGAMQFMAHVLGELDDIPDAQAQPWLLTLRNIRDQVQLAHASAFTHRVEGFNKKVRQSLTDWLRGKSSGPSSGLEGSGALSWRQWENVRNDAVTEALSLMAPGDQFLRGLFIPDTGNVKSAALTRLMPTLLRSKEKIVPDNQDPANTAIWAILRSDAMQLIGNAMARSACWINQQWKSAVIWPLDKFGSEEDYDELQSQTHELVSRFLAGPAHPLLTINNGDIAAAAYAGIELPFNEEFIGLINRDYSADILKTLPERTATRRKEHQLSIQKKLDNLMAKQQSLSTPWSGEIISQPATIPDGAPVIPVGTKISLHCQSGDQTLSNMNFLEKERFNWRPGQCTSVTLSILFPKFTVAYHLDGEDAWPNWVRRFGQGDTIINSDEFSEGAQDLKELGIHQILVRFSIPDALIISSLWQAWSDNASEIDLLKSQINELDEPQPLFYSEAVSALPNEIAQCR
jgi:type VI secretion system protein ImpL